MLRPMSKAVTQQQHFSKNLQLSQDTPRLEVFEI